jgi:hypothetical protein
VRQAGEWMRDHAAEVNAATPEVSSGEVVVDA